MACYQLAFLQRISNSLYVGCSRAIHAHTKANYRYPTVHAGFLNGTFNNYHFRYLADDVSDKKDAKQLSSQIIVKVQPASKKRKTKTDFSQSYTANNYIPAYRALSEYLLEQSDLDPLQKYVRRSPYPGWDNISVYKRKDLELKAIEKYGNLEKLQHLKEAAMQEAQEDEHHINLFHLRKTSPKFEQQESKSNEIPFLVTSGEKAQFFDVTWFWQSSSVCYYY